MPKPPLPDELQALLREPNPAVMASLKPDGSPLSVATWYLWEDDGRVLINLDHSRARLEHLRADPRVSLTVLDNNWYRHVSLQGRVAAIEPDEGLKDIDRLSSTTAARPTRTASSARFSAWIEIDTLARLERLS